MNTRMAAGLGVLVLAACGLAEDASKTARTTLDRAIQQMGGSKLLAPKALSGTSQGSVTTSDNKIKVANEWTVQGMNQMRWVTQVSLNDNPSKITLVLNGDQGWIKAGDGNTNDVDKKQLKVFLQLFAALRLAETLVPLKNKEWKLSSLGELKIGEAQAVGIKVTRKDYPDIDLYFDKATSLPIQVDMRILEPDAGMDVPYSARFSAYKKVDGRQYFTRLVVLRDDKEVIDMTRSDFKPAEKVEDETFAKP
ncbi:MAG: hypothetical protein U0840_07210 [Gemmataceae bacterium]